MTLPGVVSLAQTAVYSKAATALVQPSAVTLQYVISLMFMAKGTYRIALSEQFLRLLTMEVLKSS